MSRDCQVELIGQVDLQDFGEITLFAGDINGDGKLELVFPQGADGPKPAPSTGFYPHEKTIHCVTAIDLKGNVLWQNGTPMGADFRKYHGSGPCLVHDLDADGRCEVVYATAVEYNRCVLRKLRGEDGSLAAERETWASWGIVPANLRGLSSQRDFLLGDALWLVFAYDEDLQPLWKWHRYYGGGHHHCAADVEGKGVDDVFIGVGRYDAAGKRIWWRPDLDGVMEQMPCCPHMDKTVVRRFFANRRQYQVLWVGGHDVAMLDAADGTLLWRLEGRHIHNYAVGHFDPQSSDLMVYASERDAAGPSWLLTAEGKALWEKHLGPGTAATITGAGASGSDLLLITGPKPGERPYVMSHDGRKIAELPDVPPRPDVPQRDGQGPDSGRTFHVRTVDIDGDGRDEVLAFNRRQLLIYDV